MITAHASVRGRAPSRGLRVWIPLLLAALLLGVAVAVVILARAGRSGAARMPCVYTNQRISSLAAADLSTSYDFKCAIVYNAAAPTWQGWEAPWFLSSSDHDTDWGAWAGAAEGRRLIIGQSLVPSDVDPNWRREGAAGDFDKYAETLARNLVAAGVGNAVIRLAPEMNGTWNLDNVGATATEMHEWTAYWTRVVTVMRSVPGAAFVFDWNLSVGYRALPLSEIYPGDSVVDIIGLDIYDTGSATDPDQRWSDLRAQPGGVDDIVSFAVAHRKPVSVPEWGEVPVTQHGGGDDPAFVRHVAGFVAENDVVYNGYWDASSSKTLDLQQTPNTLATYRQELAAQGRLRGGDPARWPEARSHALSGPSR